VRLVQCTEFDIAILDVNVNGKVISPVAEALQLRGLPFIFATGYGVQGLPEKPMTGTLPASSRRTCATVSST